MDHRGANIEGRAGLRPRTGAHQALLGLVLVVLLFIVGTDAVWSADEGALLYQVSALADGRGWSFDHPFPEADPDGTRYPLHLSSWAAADTGIRSDGLGPPARCPVDGVGCRYVSLAKHTTYLWVAAGLYQLGGYPAVLALSVLGTLAAAIGAARLAARVEPAAEVPVLWLVGVGSPLLINSYVAWAHTPTAALFVWAVYWLTADETGRTRVFSVLAGSAALLVACLLRTEAPLAGLAVAIGWIGLALPVRTRRRPERGLNRPLLVSGGSALLATMIGLTIDRATATPTAGPVEPPSFAEAFGLIDGRLEGFANTWLRPGYVMVPLDLLLVLSAVSLITTAVFVRRGEQGLAVPTVMVAVGCLAIRFVLMPVALVPGLLMACPILAVGLILVDREAIRHPATAPILVPFVLFCGAVLATQYRGGGGGEWGGRYFAVGLPLGLAVAGVGLVQARWKVRPADRRRLGGLLVTGVVLLNLMGLLGVREIRNRTTDLAATVTATADAETSTDNGGPVVVTTMNGLGRWMWRDLDAVRMLRVSHDELPEVGRLLTELDVEHITLVSLSPEADRQALAPWFRPGDQPNSQETSSVAGTVFRLHRH